MGEQKHFKRGDIFYVNIPKLDYKHLPRPSFILEGKHMYVVLHDSDHCGYSQNQVVVAPISEAKSAKLSGKILPSHIPLKKDSYEFITKDCYICTHQPIPINRAWLLGKSPKGNLKKKHIKQMDIGIMHSLGLLDTLFGFADLTLPKVDSVKKHKKNPPTKNSLAFLLSNSKNKKKKKKKAV
ncbi:type II toxin-antitoxin system PemK/MazF family toxin [Paenibacillus chitinolyticus]